MNEMTATNLRSAYGGESQANMRYKVWGARAREEGFPNVARLFEAIAYAEEVHAGNHFHALADEKPPTCALFAPGDWRFSAPSSEPVRRRIVGSISLL